MSDDVTEIEKLKQSMGTRISKKWKQGHRRHIVQLSIIERIEINDETIETSCIEREKGKRKRRKESFIKAGERKNERKEIPRCFRQYAVFWILL